jgi:hypothetical protein
MTWISLRDDDGDDDEKTDEPEPTEDVGRNPRPGAGDNLDKKDDEGLSDIKGDPQT